jgi:hypothetical protein
MPSSTADQTPTEDFSDYLNEDTTTKPLTEYEQYVMNTQGVPVSEAQFNASNQLAPDGDIGAAGFTSDLEFQKSRDELADQMMFPEDALTPEVPQENAIQKHIDFNEFLKTKGLSPQDYNVLGGYDVQQTMAPGNPLLGGAINLASPFYNLAQMAFDSAKDAQGNVIKQYVPDMYEDAQVSGAYYDVPSQKFLDIPGSAARNIQGGLGLLTDPQKQQYQDLRSQYEAQSQDMINQRLPYMQQDQQDYQQRIAQIDPNEIYNRFTQNLQNTTPTNISEYETQLRSNLTPAIVTKAKNFLSNPIVQGVGALLTGGTSALGKYALGQIGGNVLGNIISDPIQKAQQEQDLINRGLADDYTATPAQQGALASEGFGYAKGGKVGLNYLMGL